MSALQTTPGMVVFRRYLGAIGGLLAALAVALYVYATRAGVASASTDLLTAAAFGFAHGVALAALAPLAQRPVALFGLCLLLLGVILFCGGALAQLVLALAAGLAMPLGAALAITGWLLYAWDRLKV
ncbi:MAG: DUF423 domain-containing protein [Thermomonas sp.]|uniref:DUF423 domain-containing protein n=1 Tax=Thermomonas sp. TaxID=1971895 RepID=UPI001E00CBE1|nr:DUF423 domain-containing protein [Thermomonas sp.]MBZ0087897.1 DUF423 domain-containing protein [Thermomonas sp.]MCO5056011.1 DUF423 domain-containing protein [Thermomonas sp.]